MGGGVVKALILQFFFWDMEIVCTWSHKSRLSRILHFLQRCCLFPRMLYFLLSLFLFSILEKKKCLYTMMLMPAMNAALYCCTYYQYIYIYTLFDNLLLFFHNSLCFSIIMYLILNIHDCNVQRQILHFLKRVLHPFMLFMSALQKRTWPDWTCTSSKDGLITIESRPFPGIIYILPEKRCLVGKKYTLTLCMKAQLKLEKCTFRKTAVSWTSFFLRRSCILKTTLLSAVLQWIVYCTFVKM